MVGECSLPITDIEEVIKSKLPIVAVIWSRNAA
jgi:hypothetical protein